MIKINLLKEGHGIAYQYKGEGWFMSGQKRFYLYGIFALIALMALSQVYLILFVPFGGSVGIRLKPPPIEVAETPKVLRPAEPVAPAPAPPVAAIVPEVSPKVEPRAVSPTPPFEDAILDGRGAKSHPYAVHVFSFRDQTEAVQEAKRLLSKGYMAYVSPAEVPDRGTWYRVILGRYKDTDSASKEAERYKKENRGAQALVMKWPYAIEVAQADSIASAAREALSLKEKGYRPYLLQADADSERAQKFLILLGAFPTKDQAERQAASLKKEGISYRVIAP